MEGIKPPNGVILTGPDNNWSTFKQNFLLYLSAANPSGASEARKVAIFLNCAGDEALEVYNASIDKRSEKTETLNDLLQMFDTYASPRKNLTLNTYEFLQMRQEEHENINHYVTRLRNKARTCELGELNNRLIIMMIVVGCVNKSIKERLLKEEDLDLEQTLKICRAVEAGKAQIELLENKIDLSIAGQSCEVDVVRKTGVRPRGKDCNYCGSTHMPRMCPAFGRRCLKCNKYNHFAPMCKAPQRNTNAYKYDKKKVDNLEEYSENSDQFRVGSIMSMESLKVQPWLETFKINGVPVVFKLDTGADCINHKNS